MDLDRELRTLFGFSGFRPGQREVIEAILQGRDVLALMPTGAGKSLCYQFPAFLRQGLTLVISPLIALMKDQIDFLSIRHPEGIAAIDSTITRAARRVHIKRMINGRYHIMFVAPERFRGREFIAALKRCIVSLLVVDEAHCISEWGHDFRPDYLHLGHIRKVMGDPQVLALTATAPEDVQQDIIKQLDLRDPAVIKHSLDRPNLTFEVHRLGDTKQKRDKLLSVIKELPRPGIIYAHTRDMTERVASWLTEAGVNASCYHAGLDNEVRKRVQDDFMEGRYEALAATCAFGMGVDKSDVRFIIHTSIPGSLEAYYQEAGRAGRDGKPSRCLLFFSPKDQMVRSRLLTLEIPELEDVKKLHDYLLTIKVGNTVIATREELTAGTGLSDTKLEVALKELDRVNLIERLPNSARKTFIKTYLPLEEIQELEGTPPWAKEFWAGFNDPHLDLLEATNRLGTAPGAIEDYLWELYFEGIIDNFTAEPGYTLLLSERYLEKKWHKLETVTLPLLKERRFHKLAAMVNYATRNSCRKQFMLEFMSGESLATPCGACDICIAYSLSGSDAAVRRPIEGTVTHSVLHYISLLRFGIGLAKWVLVLSGSKAKTVENLPLNQMPSYGAFKDKSHKSIRQALDELVTAGLLRQTVGDYPVLELAESGFEALRVGVPPNLEPTVRTVNSLLGQYVEEDEEHQVTESGSRSSVTEARADTLILECVYHNKNRVGRSALARLLTGAQSAQQHSGKADNRYFGVLSGMTQKAIISRADALLDQELLAKTDGMYPLLSLTSKGERYLLLPTEAGPQRQNQQPPAEEPAQVQPAKGQQPSTGERLLVLAASEPPQTKQTEQDSPTVQPTSVSEQKMAKTIPASHVNSPTLGLDGGVAESNLSDSGSEFAEESAPKLQEENPDTRLLTGGLIEPDEVIILNQQEQLRTTVSIDGVVIDCAWIDSLKALIHPTLPPALLKHLLLALGYTGEPSMLRVLESFQDHTNPVIRMAAREALNIWQRRSDRE